MAVCNTTGLTLLVAFNPEVIKGTVRAGPVSILVNHVLRGIHGAVLDGHLTARVIVLEQVRGPALSAVVSGSALGAVLHLVFLSALLAVALLAFLRVPEEALGALRAGVKAVVPELRSCSF